MKETLLFLWVCILFACLGGNYTFFPTVVTETFGVKYNGVLIGFLLLSEIPSSLIFTFLYENLKEIFGGWVQLTVCMAGFGLASTLLSATYSPEMKDDNNPNNEKEKYKTNDDSHRTSEYLNHTRHNNHRNNPNGGDMNKYTQMPDGSHVDIIGDDGTCSNQNQYIIDPNTGFRTSIASLSSAAGTSIASIQGASYINSHINYSDIENEHNKYVLQQQQHQLYQQQRSESPMMTSASASLRQDVSSTGAGGNGGGGGRYYNNNVSAASHGAAIDYSIGNTSARSDQHSQQHHAIYKSSHSGAPPGAPDSENMM